MSIPLKQKLLVPWSSGYDICFTTRVAARFITQRIEGSIPSGIILLFLYLFVYEQLKC